MKVPLFALSLILLIHSARQLSNISNCHYSCQTCHLPYHQFCTTCPGNNNLLVVKQPSEIPLQFRTNFTPTGICTEGTQGAKPNVLGIVLISAFIMVPLTRSQLLFNVVLCLQSFGLLYFLQIGWLNPVYYILNALTYLMPCNIITTSIKQNSWKFQRYSYFYLDNYFVQPEILKSLALLGIIDIIIFFLLILAIAIKALKLYYFPQKYNQLFLFSQQFFKSFTTCFSCMFLLLIQQTILSIIVSFQFESESTPTPTLIITIVYALMIVGFIAIVTKFKISLFPNRLTQIYAIARKIIYPIFVAIPFNNQYLLILFMWLLCAMQGFFDYKIEVYPLKSRNSIFKLLEFITIILFAAFYGIDYTAKAQLSPLVMNGILASFICLSLAFFYIQGGFAIKQKCIKVQAVQQNNMIPENSIISRNNTTQLVSTKRQNTEANLVDQTQSKQKHHRAIDKFIIQQGIQNDLQPPKVSRDATKDSLLHDSQKRQKQGNIDKVQGNKGKQQANIDKLQKQKQMQGEKKGLQKKQQNKELSNELKKRYGIK